MSNQDKLKLRWMTAAARWLPLLFAGTFVAGMHAQTSGVAPLISGDCSVSTSGVMTCSKTGGTVFAASATTDTTNAANITSGTLSTARTSALSGDVTKAAGSASTTVTAINGMSLPTTAGITATNSAGQIVAATSSQARALTCSGTASTSYYCDGNTGTWTAIPWTLSANANYAQYNTFASAASAPAMLSTGSLYTGGTGTTTTPHWYINQGAAAVTTWSPNGTDFGINAPSGFTGNLIDLRTNGGSTMFSVNYRGDMTVGNYLNLQNSNLILGVAAGLSNGKQWISTSATGGFNAPLYTPSSSTATCSTGTVAWDANYFYVCKATNTWMRSALSSF